ncbi:amidohydrolase [bacterium]|nr:amidohydrolase [bacterium]
MRIIDAHSHVMFGSWMGSIPDPEGKKLIKELETCNISSAVISAIDSLITTDFKLQQKINEKVSALQNKYDKILYGLGTVTPNAGKKVAMEIKRCKEKLGLYGLKLHTWLQAFSVMAKDCDYIFKTASELGMPILFHDGTPPYSTPLQIAHIAHKYPNLKIILGHGGLKDMWIDALEAAKKNKNIYIATCGTPYLGIKTMIKELGIERIMFGSDSGFADASQTIYQLNNVKKQNLKKAELELALYKNANRIFSLNQNLE